MASTAARASGPNSELIRRLEHAEPPEAFPYPLCFAACESITSRGGLRIAFPTRSRVIGAASAEAVQQFANSLLKPEAVPKPFAQYSQKL